MGICLLAFNSNIKMCNWTNFSYFSVYIENGVACDKPQSLLDVLYLGGILDTFGNFIGLQRKCMQRIIANQAREWKNMANCFLQNIQHIYMKSVFVVMLHAELKTSRTIPAGR